MSREPVTHNNYGRKNIEDARRFPELKQRLIKDEVLPSDGTVFTLVRSDEPDGHD